MTANRRIALLGQDRTLPKNVLPDLRAPGLLAKWPIIGISLFVFGSLMFGALALNLFAHGPLLEWDRLLANTLPAIGQKSSLFVRYLITSGFYLGGIVIGVIDLFLSIYFLSKRRWQELAMVVIGGAGAAFLFYSLSSLIGRERPPTQIWNIVDVASFPSGHTISAVICYGLLAYLLAPKMPSTFWKGVVVAAAVLMIGFIGFSRVFTGGHYLTDVLAGCAVGIAWFGVIITLIETYTQKRRSQTVQKETIHEDS